MSLTFALSVLLSFPLDGLLLGAPTPVTLPLRMAWSAVIVLHMALWTALGRRWESGLDGVYSVVLGVFFLGLVFVTGGTQSPYMKMVPSVPLMTALVFTETALPALLMSAVCLLGTAWLWLRGGQVMEAGAWSFLVGTSGVFGILGAVRFRMAQAAGAEALLERGRREALEKLALAARHRSQTEKLAMVGRLAANVIHEINNPLAFVRSNMDFLRTEVLAQPLPAPVRMELRTVFDETHLGVERIRQIVSDLKGFSRMDGEEPGECALADVVTEAALLAGLRLKNVARLTVDVPRELPPVVATPRRLVQVMLNLLLNAGDALEEARVRDGEVRVTGQARDGWVWLDVEDNGPGFPPEVLGRLFDAFFTTKGPDKGTGLGLCLSRELVERFGGTLQAENRSEGGARLRLSMPLPST